MNCQTIVTISLCARLRAYSHTRTVFVEKTHSMVMLKVSTVAEIFVAEGEEGMLEASKSITLVCRAL